MCGLAGVVTWDQRHRIDRTMLARLSASIAHRGPDGHGEFINHDQVITSHRPQCGLVHRRLAIIDLDQRAAQPFGDGTRCLVFNGEIYNFRELRGEITAVLPDYTWRTSSDTEVLLLAYAAWGTACLQKLNGMFALAIWDETEKSLFLARDRMGQKPLYYAANGVGGTAWDHQRPPSAIAFASELSSLRLLPWFNGSISNAALGDYLRYGYVPSPATIYNGAWKLQPATWLKITPAGVQIQRYFDPNRPLVPVPDYEAKSLTRKLVTQAVKRQLVADVPVGCFLSGGIDSSIIAAAMVASQDPSQPVMTFSIGFDDPRYDESQYAMEVATHLGTLHRQVAVQTDAAEDLVKLAIAYGEPFGDSSALPTHYLSRESRADVKVALSGDGGDELFGGYDRYRAMAISQSIARLPAPLRILVANRLWQLLPGTHPKSKLARLKRLLATVRKAPGARYESYIRFFDEKMMNALLPGQRRGDSILPFEDLFNEQLNDRDIVRAAMSMDRITYLPDDLLTKLDRASMLHALEVRSPFMDHELVHFAAGLSSDQLLAGGGKRMLREAFAEDLPESVFSRAKMGFAVPIGEWFRGDLAGLLRGALFAADSFTAKHLNVEVVRKLVENHHIGRADHSQRLYALLMLELWWQTSRP